MFWHQELLLVPVLGEATDQAPRLAVNMPLKIGQRFLAAFFVRLLLEHEDGQRAKERKREVQSGNFYWTFDDLNEPHFVFFGRGYHHDKRGILEN